MSVDKRPQEHSVSAYTSKQFLELETQVWAAMARGDVDADAQMLTDDFLGVYPSGFGVKADHVGQLEDGPTVAEYVLSEARIQVLSDELVLLSYCARWTRNTPGAEPELMYVTSIWRLLAGQWKNVFSQDTPAEEPTAVQLTNERKYD